MCLYTSVQLFRYSPCSQDTSWKVGQIACPPCKRSFRGGTRRAFVRADIQLDWELRARSLKASLHLLGPLLRISRFSLSLAAVELTRWASKVAHGDVFLRGSVSQTKTLGREGGVRREALEVRGVGLQTPPRWVLYWPSSGVCLGMKVSEKKIARNPILFLPSLRAQDMFGWS